MNNNIVAQNNPQKIGGDIDSWCGKCKLMLAHTVEAMVGDKPARVSCNTCNSQHRYRPTAPAETAARKAVNGDAAAAPKPSLRGRRTAKTHAALMAAGTETAAKVYSQKTTYRQGDIFEHPVFGRGVTTVVKDESKIEVSFEGGSKTLIHGR